MFWNRFEYQMFRTPNIRIVPVTSTFIVWETSTPNVKHQLESKHPSNTFTFIINDQECAFRAFHFNCMPGSAVWVSILESYNGVRVWVWVYWCFTSHGIFCSMFNSWKGDRRFESKGSHFNINIQMHFNRENSISNSEFLILIEIFLFSIKISQFYIQISLFRDWIARKGERFITNCAIFEPLFQTALYPHF